LLTGSILYAQSSTLEELGYISAMELTFAGMSYIATQDQWHGEKIAGGFDVIMAVGGLKNAAYQEPGIHTIGYYLLSAGFFAKAYFNIQMTEQRNSKEVFWINFIAYNALVFSGYFLDSLR
ncbi:MAG: hypothetical protein HOM94_06655, partial [Candidatus Marinimicrobia bacterium]|nr:hypothetical protein [Candidatus Neomarinimicrobiota bacterium]